MTHTSPTVHAVGAGDPLSPAPRPGSFCLDRWEVLQLVKETAQRLGIGEREIAVLGAHLSLLPRGPVRSENLCMSYAEIGGILDRANCMDERRFRRGETRLAEAGLIVRKLSGNGRRFPVRDGRGQVIDAYGIDLRPLFHMVPELRRIKAELDEASARRRALRSRISARLTALRRSPTPLPRALSGVIDEIRNLCRRKSSTIDELVAADRRLATAFTAPDTAQPDNCPADAGQIDRPKESPQKETDKDSAPVRIARLWAECPRFASYFPDPPHTPGALLKCLHDFLGFLGLSSTARCEVARKADTEDLLRMLDYLLVRLTKIGNPAAYLVTMVGRYEAGEAVAAGRVQRSISAYDRGHNGANCTGMAVL